MSTITIPRYAGLQIQPLIWTRNGKSPDASFQTQIAAGLNQCARYRIKELARFASPIADIPAGAADTTRARWRFACHTSPMCRFIFARALIASGTAGGDTPLPFARLRIVDGTPTTIGDALWNLGGGDGDAPDTPAYFGSTVEQLRLSGAIIEAPPSTELYGTFEDESGARLIAATVYEYTFDGNTDNGYLPQGFAAGSPVFDEDRGDLVELARETWKVGSSPIWHWSSNTDLDAPETIDNTYRNLIDDTSTTVTAASPGATFDLSNRSRLGLATAAHGGVPGVPCVMKVYGKTDSGTGGAVRLLNSATVVATCSGFTSTPSWVSSGVFYLSAAALKHDLHYSHTGLALGVGFTPYAVSIYQYEA